MSILHLVPVVTSTVSLWFAFDQFFFLGIFLNEKVESHAKETITPYWNTMINTGLPIVIAPLLGTIASTAAILGTTSEEYLRNKGSFSWYIASTALAASHFAFVPIILPKIKGLQTGGLTPTLRQWMRIHITRSVTVDLFCWITCIVASAKTLSA
ncbi:integral membrane protein [Fusarium heterosporum]|uniref:Integral membrane protein n=1 Tax=Fusarium heterosporum TaxID=42747 RepID=A0A8H5THG6_FUSHE|nr:integral membrane protein [Fusarium heterosporum]